MDKTVQSQMMDDVAENESSSPFSISTADAMNLSSAQEAVNGLLAELQAVATEIAKLPMDQVGVAVLP